MIQKAQYLAGLVFLVQSMTACSNSQFLKSMSLSVTDQNNQSFINLTTEVAMGNIALAELTIPITDPKNGKELGSVALQTAADGNQEIVLSVNSTAVLSGNASLGSTLPNGRAIPGATGVSTSALVGIPVLNNSVVYVGGDMKAHIIVGMAITIQAFDTLSVIGNSNIFFQETFNTSLSGLAGLYTSTTPDQSGIAVFAEYTAPATTTTTTAVAAVASKALLSSEAASPAISVSGKVGSHQYNTKITEGSSTSGEQTAYNFFYGEKQVVRPQ